MKLGEAIVMGQSKSIEIEDSTEYTIAGVQSYGKGVVNRRTELGKNLKMKKYQVIEPDYLMWCKVDTKNGAFGITKPEHAGSLASTNMALAKINTEKFNPYFLERLFTFDFFHGYITHLSSGSTNRKYLTPKQLSELVQLPNLSKEEQDDFIKLVDRIENLEISTELTHQLDLVKQLRQAFLREAMQGKLVPQDPNDEPASVLLEKIKAEKERLIKEKKLKRGKASSQTVSKVNEWSIPSAWVTAKTDDIFFVTKLAGFEYTKHINLKETGEIPVIRAQNVRPFIIDKTNLLFIDEEISLLLDRCALIKESLLVTFIGAGIGDVARFCESERWHLAPNVAKLEPFEGCEAFYNLKYLNYFLSSPDGREEIFKHVKATAQPSLSMGTIRDIDLPLPPLSEQQRIVAKLDELMAYCDDLEASIKESQQQNELLLQQVLREALESKSDILS
jgi:restriction endonuclease S subunit